MMNITLVPGKPEVKEKTYNMLIRPELQYMFRLFVLKSTPPIIQAYAHDCTTNTIT